MQNIGEGYVPISGFKSVIADRLHPPVEFQFPRYDVVEIAPVIDSANLVPSHWNAIGSEIIQHYDQYDGFIVLHGTDTMAYSASALSFLLMGLDKPVIFTGSQIPLIEPRSDAQENLCTALILAAYHPVPEVTIFFNGKLLRGNRATKSKASGLDAFESPNYPWLGQIGSNIELHKDLFFAKTQRQFTNPDFSKKTVAILPIYPGIAATTLEALAEGLDGLILQSYGVGNLPSQNLAFMSALKTAVRNGCVILNISQCLQAEVYHGQYASSAELDDIGIISGANMTREAAFTKLCYLLAAGYNRNDIHEKLRQSLVGEVDD